MRSEPPPSEEVRCDDVVDALAAFDEVLTPEVGGHVARCLRCQAEVANYRRLQRTLRSLAARPVPLDPTLHHDIVFALDHAGERGPWRVPTRTAATLGGLAAAAGVLALATRQRRSGRLAG